jgi:phosphatidylserine/phosphatidylglycerophosphate/cardiolipin synthase-like enzyme
MGYLPAVELERWFLTAGERDNPHTGLDRRRPDRLPWSTGNEVRALVHGRTYFAELLAAVRDTRAGDLVLFTDWRGDPDERLAGPGTEVSRVACDAAGRGVLVKGLIWRSHLDRFYFSEAENRHLGETIEAAGGEAVRDMRVRAGGSHHQKLVVVRYRGRPERDVAFVGGIDLCHGRNDDAVHEGDPQAVAMSPRYGTRPPWHDIQLAIRGPAVGDVEYSFRERWSDPTPVTRNPFYRLADLVRHDDDRPDPLPDQLPDPPECGTHAVQVLRTYPYRRRGYPFAPRGERSVAHGYAKAIGRARYLIYLEDQYLWSARVVTSFADALAANPRLHLIAVVPLYPDQPGNLAEATEVRGRGQALAALRRAGGDRVAVFGLENRAGTPVYVHAKACVVDDTWLAVGSDNINLRSWTHDSELGCAVLDLAAHPDEAGGGLPRAVRLALSREHLDRVEGDDADLVDPDKAVAAFVRAADELEAWYAGGRVGARPPGRLRWYREHTAPRWARAAAAVLYPTFFDPDGRPAGLRRTARF